MSISDTSLQTFRQLQPPKLFKFMTFKHPQNDLSLQFWDSLVDFIEIEKQVKAKEKQTQTNCAKKLQYLVAKGKQGSIVIWKFISNYLVVQKTVRLPYAVQKQITMIKMFQIKLPKSEANYDKEEQEQDNLPNANNSAILVFIGYFDGVLEVYTINEDSQQKDKDTHIQMSPKNSQGQSSNSQNVFLVRYLSIKNQSQQPSTNVQIYSERDLYVVRVHQVFIYKDVIKEIKKKILSIKHTISSAQTLLTFKQFQSQAKISVSITPFLSNLHIYNQLQGLYSFKLPNMENRQSIIDSVKCLAETSKGDLIIGSADDSMKIIYAGRKEIERIVGLKNFVSCVRVNQTQKKTINQKESVVTQLWISTMHGDLHYMKRKEGDRQGRSQQFTEKSIKSPKNHQSQIVIYEQQFAPGRRICDNGIRRIYVGQSILIVVDVEMNITAYNSVRTTK